MLEGIIDYLGKISLPIWIGIAGFILSIINLIRSILEKRIKVGVSYGTNRNETSITIFNHSVKNIIITHLELYTKNRILFGRKEFINTPFDYPESVANNISSHKSKNFIFKDQFSNASALYKGKRAYIILHVSNKKKITKRLR